MLAQLQDPSVSDAAKLNLLRRVPADQLRGIDVAGIVSRPLAQGNLNAIRGLRYAKLSGSDLVVLDRAFIEGMGKSKNQWWQVRQYLQASGRKTWDEAKPLIEEGLRRGGEQTKQFAQSLTWMRPEPPKDYVLGVIESYDLPEQLVNQLKQKYGIQ